MMGMRPLFTAVAFCALLAPSLLSAQVTKSASGYLFRMKLRQGDSYSYTMNSVQQTSPTQSLPINMAYTMKVLKVANGVADVQMTVTSPLSKTPQVNTIKMDSRGIAGANPSMQSMNSATGMRLPEKALKVGGTWTETQSMGSGTSVMKVSTVYTFAGVQTVDKVSCAVFDVKTNSTGPTTVSATGKVYVEMSNGMLFKSDLATTMTINPRPSSGRGGAPSQPMTVKGTVTVRRK